MTSNLIDLSAKSLQALTQIKLELDDHIAQSDVDENEEDDTYLDISLSVTYARELYEALYFIEALYQLPEWAVIFEAIRTVNSGPKTPNNPV